MLTLVLSFILVALEHLLLLLQPDFRCHETYSSQQNNKFLLSDLLVMTFNPWLCSSQSGPLLSHQEYDSCCWYKEQTVATMSQFFSFCHVCCVWWLFLLVFLQQNSTLLSAEISPGIQSPLAFCCCFFWQQYYSSAAPNAWVELYISGEGE